MAETRRVRLKVVGVPCASCAIPIRRVLEKSNGITSVGSNYLADLILVDYDPEVIRETEIVKLIEKVGYPAIPIRY